MIFHESAGGPVPLELIGEKTELTPALQKNDQKLAERALELANAWRKYAPHVKLVIGNTGVSLGAAGRLFRAKYPADKIDFLGEESVGMTMPPERSVAYPSWMLRELAKMYGYDNVKPEACYEWKDRVERDCDSPRVCAAYRVRDILAALAWNYQLIPVGSICDVGNSYYNTIWGAGSASRYPLLQPYPAMTAVSAATQVLDQVKNPRLIPTGSPTVYFLELQRGGEYVYAGWTARGVVNMNADFGNAKVRCVDFFGRKSELKTQTVSLSEEPCYFISDTPVKSASAAMSRAYPREQYPGMDKMRVVSAMDNPDGWTLAEGEDSRLKVPIDEVYLSAMRPGKFRLSGVQDEEKGKCLEVSLIPEGECPALMREYGFIRLNKPAPIAENANTVGLWVKGNSCWGKIFFELEDADGEIWLSAGTGGYGCPVYDWEEKTGISFDGWHFIQFPVTAASPVKIHSPGDNQWQWQSEHNGDGQITCPLKLRGIGFALSRKTLNLVEMEPVKNLSVRFSGFSAY